MKRINGKAAGIGITALMAFVMTTQVAQAYTRTTAAAGYWTNTATWVDSLPPAANDDVVIDHAVTLDVSPPVLASCSNNATLTFVGWQTVLTATVVIVNGTITHPPQSDTNGVGGVYGDWTPDNRVWIVCTNLTVSAGKSINVNGQGYKTGAAGCGPGSGPAGSPPPGAGHGGRGASPSSYSGGGAVYGSATEPLDPGSASGSGYGQAGGNGGGAVRIEASGFVSVNGSITANGETGNTSWGGRGSGGSVYITCDTFAGTGMVSAAGGEYNGESHAGGGGGRVAVVYNTTSQAAVSPQPTVTLSAKGGRGRYFTRLYMGDPGTVYVPDTRFFPPAVANNGFVPVIPGFTSWAPNSFTVNDTWVKFPEGFSLLPTNTLTVAGSVGRLDLSSNVLIQCRHVVVTNFGQMFVSAAATNGAAPGYGARLDISERLAVHSNAVLYLISEPRNGGSVYMSVANLSVLKGGLIDADGRGFRGADTNLFGYGPGRATLSTSPSRPASYGGLGGGDGAGLLYGNSNAPVLPGSGSSKGYASEGAAGGGLVWVEAADVVDVSGAISARGQQGVQSHNAGGSGGAIYLTCKKFTGSDGLLSAAGGPGGGENARGGGGGRIAIWRQMDTSVGLVTNIAGGAGSTAAGSAGSFVWGMLRGPGTILMVK